jgi:methionyl-tRNA formyltransferase
MSNPKIAFFGTPEFAVIVLEELKEKGYKSSLIVTQPDTKQGRKLILTPPPTKLWAEKNNIKVIQPENLNRQISDLNKKFDLFIIASYGKIIPKSIVEMPKYGSLNVHPSLLPKYRGSSPIENMILNDEKEIGVTIMLMDEKMDHGPIISQKKLDIPNWPIDEPTLHNILAHEGGKMISETIEPWIKEGIKTREQNHDEAGFTKKIEKQDGEINLDNDSYTNYLKFLAFKKWPRTFFFIQRKNKKIRVVITEAKYGDGLVIEKVIPEGKKEMNYQDFLRGI